MWVENQLLVTATPGRTVDVVNIYTRTPTAPAEFDKSPRNCDGIMVTGPLTTSLVGERGEHAEICAIPFL